MSDALQLLIEERDRLNRAIEILGGAAPKRRGRPPGSKTVKKPAPQKAKPSRPKMSAAQKKKASEAMKKYWAARRKAAKKSG